MLNKALLLPSPSLNPYEFDGHIVCGKETAYNSDGSVNRVTVGYRAEGLGSIYPNTPLIQSAYLYASYLNNAPLISTVVFTLRRDLFVENDTIRAFKVSVVGNGFSGECFAYPNYTTVGNSGSTGYEKFIYSDANYTLWPSLADRIEFSRLLGGSAGTWRLRFPMKRAEYVNKEAFSGSMYSGSTKLSSIQPLVFDGADEGSTIALKIKILEEALS